MLAAFFDHESGKSGKSLIRAQNMKKNWWQKSVVYQIYPKSFKDSNGDGIGDINGITEKLEYLKKLGIDVIWLSPIYESPDVDNGYDISDYRKIRADYGTMSDFLVMLSRAHELGIKVIMDLVVNHTSDQHPWFLESEKGRDSAKRDYYIWKDPVNGKEPNNWGSCFAGPAWQYDENSGQYYLHLFAREQPDLNWDNANVRKDIYSMMRWWLDKGIDGFRMDVISLISKEPGLPDGKAGFNGYAPFTSCAHGPHVHEFLREMNDEVLSKYNKLMTVGECCAATLEEAPKYANSDGSELSMIFQFQHMSLDNDPETGSKWTIRKINIVELKRVLSSWQEKLYGKAWNSLFWNNHDQPRIVSRLGNDGKYREKSAKMLGTCLHMMQGTPYIYQGEELGMTNMRFDSPEDFRDIDSINGYREILDKKLMEPGEAFRAVCYKSRDNARTPMQWDNSENSGFTTAAPWIGVNPNYLEINAEEELKRKDSVFYYYQKLIALRKQYEVIVYGKYQLLDPENPDTYMYTRTLRDEKIICICNFTEKSCNVSIPDEYVRPSKILISNTDQIQIEKDLVHLGPYDAFVLYRSE